VRVAYIIRNNENQFLAPNTAPAAAKGTSVAAALLYYYAHKTERRSFSFRSFIFLPFLIVHEGSELVFMGMPCGLWGVGHRQTGFRVCPAEGTNRYCHREHMVITATLLFSPPSDLRVCVCVITYRMFILRSLYLLRTHTHTHTHIDTDTRTGHCFKIKNHA